MNKKDLEEFRELISLGETDTAIDKLLRIESLKKEYFNELIALKTQLRQLRQEQINGLIEPMEFNQNQNRIMSSLIDIVSDFNDGNNFVPEEQIEKLNDENSIKEYIYALIAEDKLRDSIAVLKAWIMKGRKGSPEAEKEISLIGSQFNQLVNDSRLGIVSSEKFRTEKSILTQKLLTTVELLLENDDKKIAKKEAEEKLERTAASFVQDSITELSKREVRLKLQANVWYIIGFLALILGVGIGVYFSTFDNSPSNSTINIVYIIARNVLIIALLIVASRYSFNLGKTYMNESLKNADRIHAISFGKFYLQVFGSNIKQEELRDVFKDWNTNQESAFLKLDSKDIDPKVLETILKLTETLKK
jgi:hypothetical protein